MDKCVVCGGEGTPLYAGLRRCRQCGHAWAEVALAPAEVKALYNRDYFFGQEYSDYLADAAVQRRNFALRYETLRRWLDPQRHQHLFEIGCAYGIFLESVRDRFSSVTGIDITEDGVQYARQKLDVVQADLLEHDFGGREFDVVCLWDTIEHLQHPEQYIEKISQMVAAGGLLALTTGDISSLNARLRGAHWRLIHPPTHLHYFSCASLARLLAIYGFEVVYQRYCGFYRSVDNVAHNVLVLRQQRPGLYRWLKKSGLTRFDFYLNLYDIQYVIARKC